MIAFGVNSISQSFLTSASNYVGYIDLTNDVLDNPYDTVPSYFGTLVADLDTGSSCSNCTTSSYWSYCHCNFFITNQSILDCTK